MSSMQCYMIFFLQKILIKKNHFKLIIFSKSNGFFFVFFAVWRPIGHQVVSCYIVRDDLMATMIYFYFLLFIFHLETWWPLGCFDVGLQGFTQWPPDCFFWFIDQVATKSFFFSFGDLATYFNIGLQRTTWWP